MGKPILGKGVIADVAGVDDAQAAAVPVAEQQRDVLPAEVRRGGSVAPSIASTASVASPRTPSNAVRRHRLNVGTPSQQLRAWAAVAVAPVAAPNLVAARRTREKLLVPMCLRCSKRVHSAKLNESRTVLDHYIYSTCSILEFLRV
ncbi:hypothetical protein ACLOAV_004759 [Pseudogymnoascus australis]